MICVVVVLRLIILILSIVAVAIEALKIHDSIIATCARRSRDRIRSPIGNRSHTAWRNARVDRDMQKMQQRLSQFAKRVAPNVASSVAQACVHHVYSQVAFAKSTCRRKWLRRRRRRLGPSLVIFGACRNCYVILSGVIVLISTRLSTATRRSNKSLTSSCRAPSTSRAIGSGSSTCSARTCLYR